MLLRSKLNSIWIIVFSCKFPAFKIVLFYIFYIFDFFTYLLHIFDFLYLKINKPNIHNNITDISNFQNGLNILFVSTGFYFKSKVLEGSHKGKNVFFNFWALLVKMYIFAVLVFFSCLMVIWWSQFFSGSTYL